MSPIYQTLYRSSLSGIKFALLTHFVVINNCPDVIKLRKEITKKQNLLKNSTNWSSYEM